MKQIRKQFNIYVKIFDYYKVFKKISSLIIMIQLIFKKNLFVKKKNKIKFLCYKNVKP